MVTRPEGADPLEKVKNVFKCRRDVNEVGTASDLNPGTVAVYNGTTIRDNESSNYCYHYSRQLQCYEERRSPNERSSREIEVAEDQRVRLVT